MIRVKICGITRIEDALAAAEAGADALGFVFYPPSPRHIQPEAAAELVRQLPPFVVRVGVFVDLPEARIEEIVRKVGLDAIQLHGRETAGFCARFRGLRVIKGFRMEGPQTLETLDAFRDVAWLLDSYQAGAFGGTGQTFNWDLAREAVRRGGRVLLAGGLNPGNVAQAAAAVRPYGVDVSSGVESAPGVKDPDKVREFIAAARAA